MVRPLILALFFFLPFVQKAQDLIYLTDGLKLSAKIVEVNPNDVKYRNPKDPAGPLYIISKNSILLIEYKTGETEVIKKNATTERIIARKNPDFYYLHKTTFMINGIALTNSDITFLLDHEIAGSKLSLTLLGGYNFNLNATWPNAVIRYYLDDSKKNYDLGFGINYYFNTTKRSQYFMGLLFKYMNYSYNKAIIKEEFVNGVSHSTITLEPKDGHQFAPMFVNGFQVRITPTINYKVFLGLGGYGVSQDIKESYKAKNPTALGEMPGFSLKGYIGVCFGYRF